MPVGRTQPMYALSRINKNKATDRPTRQASARAMCLLRSSPGAPLRSMNRPALASTIRTQIKPTTITVFMGDDYFTPGRP